MSVYVIASGVIFAALFGIWTAKDWFNILAKFAFLGFFVWALFAYFRG